ncbi:PTS mannitol transporter subunit IIB [Xylanimonas oleitrophica]|uniref:PTS system mannitol-specific EIICB component n=1 Tax=Xylanimonas oleitrophica TaxID=2607479 RepID=A0A2W5XWH9_9MICO|nr:PTS mannitol transporter subunit IICB [Xylanimonas oleitrophica]PZR54918.1 PTS mannitol transporter subunit IIB [Xylanimonas oleitrophica]
MSSTTAPAAAGASISRGRAAQVRLQRFGSFLTAMIMPNLPAFLAWGLITALFIGTGWLPNPILGGYGDASVVGWEGAATQLAMADDGTTFSQYLGLVGPMVTYLLPLLIANAGGRLVHGERGGVVGTIATVGMIAGSTVPMFLGAMIVGPLAAWVMKKLDGLWEGKIKPGFEMLVNMFSAGITGAALSVAAFFGIAPVVTQLSTLLGNVVAWLADHSLLPVMSLIVEPAKVLFLNNAIGNGVLVPLGAQQVTEAGHSLLFLVEANPGPGLGILLAFMVFGVGAARSTASGAAVIQFVGGIHEVYFPFVLMKPMLIVAAILGGATGVATNALFDSGLRGPASPGSILAVLAVTARGSYVGVILSVVLSCLVSFLVASLILRASRRRDLAAGESGDLDAAIAQTEANKGKSSDALAALRGGPAAEAAGEAQAVVGGSRPVRSIVFACDAGMGSSAMGASVLRDKLRKAGVEGVTVVNKAVANLEDDVDLVISQRELTERARLRAPGARHLSVDNFMNSPVYDEVVREAQANRPEAGQEVTQ